MIVEIGYTHLAHASGNRWSSATTLNLSDDKAQAEREVKAWCDGFLLECQRRGGLAQIDYVDYAAVGAKQDHRNAVLDQLAEWADLLIQKRRSQETMIPGFPFECDAQGTSSLAFSAEELARVAWRNGQHEQPGDWS
jgi:hypothetical protein